MKIKVCGMKHAQNIIDIGNTKPNYMGFIFYEPSPRDFQGDIPTLPESIEKVGVFVNSTIETVVEKVTLYQFQLVQLHGQEDVSFCQTLKKLLPAIKIIKVFSIGASFDFVQLAPFEEIVDFFLFDTKGKLVGGNGVPFNWEILKQYPYNKPFFLSGGIGPDSTAAIKAIQKWQLPIHALDINSGFEDAPALKNKNNVKHFIEKIRNMNTPNYHVDENGYYGNFGGAFIPEMLYPNVENLRQEYLKIMQEPSFEEEFQNLLRDYVGRPSPLYFAKRLSAAYNTKIYLKREDLNHTGAHKINNTIGQILVAKKLGKKRIIAETGAGQHGVATATVCALMGIECIVYMGEVDIDRQAPNVARMKMLGAEVRPALSGSRTLKDATNEAIRDWINNPVDTHYIIGSAIGPHPYPDMVTRFQSVISEEIKAQLLEKEGTENPNYVIACIGGGSNAAGTFYHYLDREDVGIIAVEAAGKGVHSGESAATSQLGKEGIIHGCKTLLMQTNDGQITEPYSISAGLDYPGVGPMHAHLYETGRADFFAITDDHAMQAGMKLSKLEGIIPAIESAHAFAVLEQKKFRPKDVVVISLSGRGDKDLNTFINYFNL